jgi:hypothetical protein
METVIKVSLTNSMQPFYKKIKKFIGNSNNIGVTICLCEFDPAYTEMPDQSIYQAESGEGKVSMTMEDFVSYSPKNKPCGTLPLPQLPLKNRFQATSPRPQERGTLRSEGILFPAMSPRPQGRGTLRCEVAIGFFPSNVSPTPSEGDVALRSCDWIFSQQRLPDPKGGGRCAAKLRLDVATSFSSNVSLTKEGDVA